MVDQKWNKNALGYGEKNRVSSDDKWNKNALNYDPNQKVDKQVSDFAYLISQSRLKRLDFLVRFNDCAF